MQVADTAARCATLAGDRAILLEQAAQRINQWSYLTAHLGPQRWMVAPVIVLGSWGAAIECRHLVGIALLPPCRQGIALTLDAGIFAKAGGALRYDTASLRRWPAP